MSKHLSTIQVKHHFPIDSSYVPFAHYSHYAVNDAKHQKFKSQIKQKNIIIGGCENSKDGFYELVVDNKANSIYYKSFKNHYKKKYANLKYIGGDDYQFHGRSRFDHTHMQARSLHLAHTAREAAIDSSFKVTTVTDDSVLYSPKFDKSFFDNPPRSI